MIGSVVLVTVAGQDGHHLVGRERNAQGKTAGLPGRAWPSALTVDLLRR